MNTALHNIMKRTRNWYHYQIRKIKRTEKDIISNKLLLAVAEDRIDFFQQIRNMRQCDEEFAGDIDGVTADIPDHFAAIYRELFSSVKDEDEIKITKKEMEDRISTCNKQDVETINSSCVERAVKKLKSSKNDPIYLISSDCHVSKFLLSSSLIPLVKDRFGDITVSRNYRSIAISSLICKLIDIIIIALNGDVFRTDELQCGFQSESSTSMCTWLTIETIGYYNRNETNVYGCLMDLSKDFDKVHHSKLLAKLVEKGLPPIICRLLMAMYRN